MTAIRSLFKYAALRHPEHASVIAQVLSIPPKRHQKRQISFLTAQESKALIDAPDQSRWEGRRDRAMLTLTIQAGLRVSELIALNSGDIQLGTGAHVRCEGKGRKQRTVPLTIPAQAVLTAWLTERAGGPTDPLFVTRTGRRLSRDAIEQRVTVHATTATAQLPITADQTAASARPAPQLRDVTAPGRRRYHRHRPLVRATRMSARPSPTSTPTSRSRRKLSRSSLRPTSNPAATNPRTRPSRSSRACDYADKPAGEPAPKPRQPGAFNPPVATMSA